MDTYFVFDRFDGMVKIDIVIIHSLLSVLIIIIHACARFDFVRMFNRIFIHLKRKLSSFFDITHCAKWNDAVQETHETSPLGRKRSIVVASWNKSSAYIHIMLLLLLFLHPLSSIPYISIETLRLKRFCTFPIKIILTHTHRSQTRQCQCRYTIFNEKPTLLQYNFDQKCVPHICNGCNSVKLFGL